MSLRSPDQYVQSLRDNRTVFFRGKRVPDVTTHPVISVAVKHASIDYELAEDPRHRDLCVVFGYQSPTRFYYVHLASTPDDRAHGVFLVDDADRVNITKTRNEGMRWGDVWHRVRVRRQVEDGTVEVFVDDFAAPAITAKDTTLGSGRVGFGSFDDCGAFDAVRLYGRRGVR